ncbi:hypothetical protein [Spirosoma rigui]|uniref:hypothetical protein n=1 Tax=Spirosoma rigui TaxID=564064 RepID=UPI0009B0665D|nr:hypothetical protein [Spirosoma rigui]
MDLLSIVFWLYLLPMGIVFLPGVLAFDKLGDMEGVTKRDIQIIAILPLFNLYTACCLVDVVITSSVDYIRNGRR